MLTLENARTAAERLVDDAVRAGADAADVLYAGNRSTSIHVRLDDRVGDVEWLCRRLFGDGLQLLGRSDRGGGRLDAARPCLA